MNSREVFLETCKFGTPDRAYRWECIGPWETTKEVWAQQGYAATQGGYRDYLSYFGMDLNVGFMNFQEETRLYTGFTNTPFFPGFGREVLEDDGHTRVVRNFNGVILRELSQHADTSMPQFISFPAETREAWGELKERLDPHAKGRYPQDWSELQRRFGERDFVLGMPLIGAFGLLRNLMGPEKALMAFYDDPGLVEDIMEHWEWMNIGFIDEVSPRLELDYVLLWEDMCFKSGPLISPAMFARFMLPRYKKVVAHARAHGIPVAAVDTDGQCDPLIPHFIEGGINLLFPLEVASGMDPRAVRKKYGKAIALIGGIDKRPLARGKEEIEAEVSTKLPQMFEEGGYFPSLDHTAPPDIPLDNFKYFLDYVRGIGDRYFGAA